jgi:hypothetical protein
MSSGGSACAVHAVHRTVLVVPSGPYCELWTSAGAKLPPSVSAAASTSSTTAVTRRPELLRTGDGSGGIDIGIGAPGCP